MSDRAVEFVLTDPEDPDARWCLDRYTEELNRRSERSFDPTVGATARPDEVPPPAGAFYLAYRHGKPIGCGAVKHHSDRPAELKRMWVEVAAFNDEPYADRWLEKTLGPPPVGAPG